VVHAAAAGTPKAIVDRLHREIVIASQEPRPREANLKQAALDDAHAVAKRRSLQTR
jgi:hypothetical protein